MREYVFLFKENNTNDRDCVRYIELSDLKKYDVCCDGKFNVHGACYSMSLKEEVFYSDMTTILTEEEYKMLCNPKKDMDFSKIINKLLSEENEELFLQVQEEEIEYLQYTHDLSREDIKYIFDFYSLDYRDRGIVGYVYDNIEEMAEEYIDECYNVPDYLKNYIDYEKFGQDMLDGDNYLELDNGRVVSIVM
jgi:hypothetical protein